MMPPSNGPGPSGQINPDVLARMMQGGDGGPPGMPPGMPQGGPPPGPPPGAGPGGPGMAAFAQMAGGPPTAPPPPSGIGPGPRPPQGPASGTQPAQLAAQGQGQDSLVAHLTPGELVVPKQVQTPQVLAVLNQAFQQAGANPMQFQAGNPANQHNPQTGMPMFDFMSSILPMALAAAGSMFLGPEVAPMLMDAGMSAGGAGMLGSSLMGGLGNMAGGLLTGNSLTNSLLSGGLSGLGSYALGGAGSSANGGTPFSGDVTPPLPSTAPDPLGVAQSAGGFPSSGTSGPAAGTDWRSGLGAAGGALLGSAMFPKPAAAAGNPDPNFNKPMGPINPNYQALLGNGQSPTPNFAGYNPYTQVMSGRPINLYG